MGISKWRVLADLSHVRQRRLNASDTGVAYSLAARRQGEESETWAAIMA